MVRVGAVGSARSPVQVQRHICNELPRHRADVWRRRPLVNLSLPQREGDHDHTKQTEQKRTPKQIRPDGNRWFIHFGLSSYFLIFSGSLALVLFGSANRCQAFFWVFSIPLFCGFSGCFLCLISGRYGPVQVIIDGFASGFAMAWYFSVSSSMTNMTLRTRGLFPRKPAGFWCA